MPNQRSDGRIPLPDPPVLLFAKHRAEPGADDTGPPADQQRS